MEIMWVRIEEFPNYTVSNFGDVVNEFSGKLLRQSTTLQGARKVNLIKDGIEYTRSVKVLVAEAFIERPDAHFEVAFDTPIHLDGNQKNNRVDNIVWRPRWFAWKYSRQFVEVSINHGRGPIRDIKTRDRYLTFFEAAVVNGILVADVWGSILVEKPTFPTWQIFEFIR